MYTHKDKYVPIEDFHQNMKRIFQTDERFAPTKETAKGVLERYINMDCEGTFATLLKETIKFFENTCGAD